MRDEKLWEKWRCPELANDSHQRRRRLKRDLRKGLSSTKLHRWIFIATKNFHLHLRMSLRSLLHRALNDDVCPSGKKLAHIVGRDTRMRTRSINSLDDRAQSSICCD